MVGRKEWGRWVRFRKEFFLDAVGGQARLRITADSEYWVWVNGEWVGQGPARSFPWRWRYEEYDITKLLSVGANTIGVLVLGSGVSTFRYIAGLSGLRCELDVDGQVLFGTDRTWLCAEVPESQFKHFRVSCQQGWQEPLLLPQDDYGWARPNFSGTEWENARVVKDSRLLVPSTTGVEVVGRKGFKRVRHYGVEGLPSLVIKVNLRRMWWGARRDALPRRVCGLVGMRFHVKRAGKVFFHFGCPWFWLRGKVRLNGVDLIPTPRPLFDFENGLTFEGTPRRGENFLVVKVDGRFHEWTLRLAVFGIGLEPISECMVARWRRRGTLARKLWEAQSSNEWSGYKGIVRLQVGGSPVIVIRDAFAETAYARHRKPLPASKRILFLSDGKAGKGEQFILDMGEETVGYWLFDVEARPGARLVANGFEVMQKGKPDFAWEMDNTCELHLVEGRHIYRALRRRAARFILLQGNGCILHDFSVLDARYPSQEGGKFECDDEILTKAYEISKRTVALCSEDTYVDCPSYEQTYWVGDARNSSLVNYFSLGDWELARHSCLLAAESLERSPFVESHVPSGWPMIIPAWSFLWMQACWECFYYTGDASFLEAVYPAMKKQLASITTQINKQGLFEFRAWNFCDWAPMDTPEKGVVAHNQGWLLLALGSMLKATRRMSDGITEEKCKKLISEVKSGCNACLWDEENQAYVDALHHRGDRKKVFSLQTQCVLALAKVPKGEQREILRKVLFGLREAPGFVNFGTPYFYFYLFELYERDGEFHRLVETLKEIWGMMLRRGVTTCWEVLPGFMPGGAGLEVIAMVGVQHLRTFSPG